MSTILVIEDERLLREEIVDMLNFEGFTTLEAADGEEGIKLAQEHLPDLVLCDIAMPKLDGYQVLLALREHPRISSIPFVFLTARSDRPFMRHGMELGADDYVTKPATNAEILAAIRARLERQTGVNGSQKLKLDEAKQTLTHLVAHELRTPLTSIMMVQDIVARQMGQLSPSQMDSLLETMHSGSKRLAHLIEQMVYFTELETGILSPENIDAGGQPLYLWQTLTAAVDLGRRFAHRQHDGLIRYEEHDPDATVIASAPPLKHALAELVANALDFSPEGKEVVVSQWQADGFVWIMIVDQGAGMSPAEADRAFLDFSQVNREAHEQQGIGLGLPLARRIIEAHGGTLTLKSIAGKGTQVTVSLPVTSVKD
jgi:two-component system sensor histidine kinase/response regulator